MSAIFKYIDPRRGEISRSLHPAPSTAANRSARSRWWMIFAILLIASAWLASLGYRHGLPIIDWEDEKTIWSMGRALVDPTWAMYQPFYPPGILRVSEFVQRAQIALGDPFINVAVTIEVMRLMSIGMFTLSTAVIALLARRMAGNLAGVTAALFWMLLPIANFQAKLALVDTWVSFWMIGSLAAAVEVWQRKSVAWFALSLLLGLLATIFKYQGAAVLIATALALLPLIAHNRRRGLIVTAIAGLIVAIFGYWLLFIHKALSDNLYLPTETKVLRPTFEFVINNLFYASTRLGAPFVFAVLPSLALILAALLPDHRAALYRKLALWVMPIVIVTFSIIVSFNGAPVFDRHYMGQMAMLAVLGGIGVALFVQVSQMIAARPQRRWLAGAAAAALVIAVVWSLISMGTKIAETVWDFSRPDRRAVLAEWARTTADGPMLISDPEVAVGVQPLYGYRGPRIDTPYNEGTFTFTREDKLTQEMIDAKGIKYIIAPHYYDGSNLETPITKLFQTDDSSAFRGPGWAAYYVGSLPLRPPDQIATFGDSVQLRGFVLSQQAVCNNEPLAVQLAWGRGNTRPDRNYSFYLHLYNATHGELSYPENGAMPAVKGRPTSTWTDLKELLVSPVFEYQIPPDLPSGAYTLWLGVYDPFVPPPEQRLRLRDGSDHVALGQIEVMSCQTF